MDYLEKFNTTFREFMEDLIRVFPDDADFRMYQLGIQTVMMLKPGVVCDVFREKVVTPFGQKILDKDESFFMDHTYDEVKSEHEEASEIIQKVKNYYATMSDTDKDTVWKYFRVLVKLVQKMPVA